MFNRSKTNDILKGVELLRVPSLQKPISRKKRKAVLAVLTLLYPAFLVYGFSITKDAPQSIKLFWLVAPTILYFLGIAITFILGNATTNALIITERGLAYWPIVAEKWEDIESYSWEEFKGLTRIPGPTVFSSCEGITLRIIHKGFSQRCLEGRTSHSIFATYLILFSPDQMAAAEVVLKQHGIRKTE